MASSKGKKRAVASSDASSARSSGGSHSSIRSFTSNTARKISKTARQATSTVKHAAKKVKHTFLSRCSSQASSQASGDEDGIDDNGDKDQGTPGEPIVVSGDEAPPSDKDQDVEELDRLKTKWTSPIYGFFKDSVTVKYDTKSRRKYQYFTCNRSPCKGGGGVRRYQDNSDRSSTANLRQHAYRCFTKEVVDAAMHGEKKKDPQASIFAMFGGVGSRPATINHRMHTDDERRAHVVRWVTESNRPMYIVEDRELRELMLAGRPQAKFPHRKTVAKDIETAFKRCKDRIKELLKKHPGKLSFATDAWTSPNHRAFVAWTVHLHHKGSPLTFLLDVYEVPESHTGETLAREFNNMLLRYELADKILSFTGDNATSNDTQTEALDVNDQNSFSSNNRVRCMNHTMNLAAKSILRPFTVEKEKGKDKGKGPPASTPDTDLNASDDDLPGLISVADSEDEVELPDDDEEIDELEELTEEEREQLANETAQVKEALTKIRGLSFAIIHSTTIALPEWRRLCIKFNKPSRLLPRDVTTRWNSTYDMLVKAKEYSAVIDAITGDKDMSFRKYELNRKEWAVLDDLIYVLKIFKDATIHFSSDKISSISGVIPAMDRIDDLLTNQSIATQSARHPDRRTIDSSVKAALRLGKKTMNRYYSLTDNSDVYRIAMVLHPVLKLDYFRMRNWNTEWIVEVERITQNAYREYAKKHREHRTDEDSESNSMDESSLMAPPAIDTPFNLFANISVSSAKAPLRDELTEYLATPTLNVLDPMKWWWDNRAMFPVLSQMALDYHSVPATSTAVERVFSQGRHLLVFTRNRLSGASIRKFLCLGSWSKRDLVRNEDICGAIKESRKEKGTREE